MSLPNPPKRPLARPVMRLPKSAGLWMRGNSKVSGQLKTPKSRMTIVLESRSVKDIVAAVEAKTGGRVDLVPDTSLHVLATVRIGTFGSGSHLIRYRPDSPSVQYHVAHQCAHILRRFETPSSNRADLLPTARGQEKVL